MNHFLASHISIGLEKNTRSIRYAHVSFNSKGEPSIDELGEMDLSPTSINQLKNLSESENYTSTAMHSTDLLIRPFYLPLVKDKEIDAAISFQIEPLLPYTVEEAVIDKLLIKKEKDGSFFHIFATQKQLLSRHLELWKEFAVDPEHVSSIPTALLNFLQEKIDAEQNILVINISDEESTAVLIKEGQLFAVASCEEGLVHLKQNWKEVLQKLKHEQEFSFSEFPENFIDQPPSEEINSSLKKIFQGINRIALACKKEIGPEQNLKLIITGEILAIPHIEEKIAEKIKINLYPYDVNKAFFSKKNLSYAVPIGLAIEALNRKVNSFINLRKNEFSYSNYLKRLKKPLAIYFVFIALFCLSFLFFSHIYFKNKHMEVKQNFVDLLAEINRPFDQFEQAYNKKNGSSKNLSNESSTDAAFLSLDDIKERLIYLHNDLKATPDSFPLFANIPKVTDLIAWLSNHPTIVSVDDKGNKEKRLNLEHLSYHLIKRPSQQKKQEKYQVKVELEFTSDLPKWAREFHDALISPNSFVDPKSEVKWSSSRGTYRTSFFLKDKTHYPSQS